MRDPASLPVIMFHSVGNKDTSWPWHALTCPFAFFEQKIKALAARGYRSITLGELAERQRAHRPPSAKQVVLTFDDGYLDNWVYAYPLLRREGWQGIIYVNPEFVEDGERPRPNLADVWEGRCDAANLPGHGFLNWGELKAMLASGVMEIGTHSMTHTWFPIGPEIVDYHHPGDFYPWLAWNSRPERKPHYLTEDQSAIVPLGTPVHAHGRSLGIRRYFPDPAVTEAVTALVAASGGGDFFAGRQWRDELDHAAAAADSGEGRYETDAEMEERYRWEILESRCILSEKLGRDIVHFCWPGGAYNDTSWCIAEEAGHDTLVVSRRDRKRWLTADPRLVRRSSCGDTLTFLGRSFEVSDPHLLYHICELQRGKTWHHWPIRWRKLITALRHRR